jgi:phospholipase C
VSGRPGATRRQFLTGAAATVAGGVLAGGPGGFLQGLAGAAGGTTAPVSALPPPGRSGIDHIVVVMMENRSFDHYLGWLPGANGRQAGLHYVDRDGASHATHHLTTYQGCAHPDPDHSYEGGRVQLNGGRCDGWLRSGENDTFAIGYYTAADQAFFRGAAPYWTTFDNYFSAVMAETYPNRFYQHSAQTDRTHNSYDQATIATIWDRLAAAGVSGKYYFSDIPFTALWYTKYLSISHPYAEFLADCATGRLPAVSFVDPRFDDEGTGTSGDDHPHADIRTGQAFLNQVYEAVVRGPQWAKTALVINYDEWGGFFDHVAPTTAPDARLDLGTQLRGFRVPCFLISPRSRRHAIGHRVYDHTSVLKMIEWRWGLPPLTLRDRAARNLAEVLDFGHAPNLTAPAWSVPTEISPPCSPIPGADFEAWHGLADLARSVGFELPSAVPLH